MAKKKDRKKIALVILVIFILALAMITASIVKRISGAGVDTGLILLEIDGDYANVSIELDIEPEIDEKDLDIKMETDDSTIPLTYEDDIIKGTLSEREFADIIEKDEVNLTGSIDIPVLGSIKVNKELKEKVNISFIHELSSSMNVENVSVEFAIFYTVIEFEILANVSRDFQIIITNTDANVRSPAGEFNAEVLELNYRTGERGSARIRLPLLGALGLALNSRNVVIESWGLSVTVNIPLFNV